MQDKHSDLDTAIVWRYNIPFDLDEENDHDDTEAPNFPTLSLYKEATAGYIAGFVFRMVPKEIHCTDCLDAQLKSDDCNITFMQVCTWSTQE